MRQVKIEKINSIRKDIMAKGYIKRSEAGPYMGTCQRIGRERYDELKKELEENGIKVSPLGISVDTMNSYIGTTKEEILKYAELGL